MHRNVEANQVNEHRDVLPALILDRVFETMAGRQLSAGALGATIELNATDEPSLFDLAFSFPQVVFMEFDPLGKPLTLASVGQSCLAHVRPPGGVITIWSDEQINPFVWSCCKRQPHVSQDPRILQLAAVSGRT